MPRALRFLFAIHAVLTGAAGIVLIVAPSTIPATVGIRLDPSAYLVCYLLAGAELGLAALSWGARSISDARALRVVVGALVVFHSTTGALEVLAFIRGVHPAIWGNVVVRIIVIALFVRYGRAGAASWRRR